MRTLMNPMLALLIVCASLLLSFLMLPIAALFFMALWNTVVSYCDLSNFISYWQSLKLCFLITVLKALLSVKFDFSK